MRWPSPSVCQSWDLEKETFRYDSCFPYDVHFLYIRDIWFAFPEIRTTTFITYEFARSASTAHCCLRSKHNSSVEFSINIVCKEKKERIPGFTRIKNTKTLKSRLKTGSYTCRSLWIAGRRDSTVFGVVDDTTTTKFANRACAVHGISLPIVIVVLKFPIFLCLSNGFRSASTSTGRDVIFFLWWWYMEVGTIFVWSRLHDRWVDPPHVT